MSNAGIPLRIIQEILGHRNLEQLQKYLEVSDEQVLGASKYRADRYLASEFIPRRDGKEAEDLKMLVLSNPI